MKEESFEKIVKPFIPFIEGIVGLLYPFAEAAIHNLQTGKIFALFNNLSKRKRGDLSPIHELGLKTEKFPGHFQPYYKKNWDGRPLKCTSITLKDDLDKPIGLICFNIDVSAFQGMQKLIHTFLKIGEEGENPVELFGGESESQITKLIEEYLEEKHLVLAHLDNRQKKMLVKHLYQKGVFNFKNAVPQLASLLKISRATIYNHIKTI